jgi:hypothetical protein
MNTLEKIKSQRITQLPFLKLKELITYELIFNTDYQDIKKFQDGKNNLREPKEGDDENKLRNFYRFEVTYEKGNYRLDADQNLAEKLYALGDSIKGLKIFILVKNGKGYVPKTYTVSIDKQKNESTITQGEEMSKQGALDKINELKAKVADKSPALNQKLDEIVKEVQEIVAVPKKIKEIEYTSENEKNIEELMKKARFALIKNKWESMTRDELLDIQKIAEWNKSTGRYTHIYDRKAFALVEGI